MTTRTRRITILLAAIILAAALLGCLDLDIDKRTEWQNDVLERQRQPGQPGSETVVPQVPQ